MKHIEYALKGLRAPFFKRLNRDKASFICPICHYSGPFMDKNGRLHAKCPKCGELERARLQYLVLENILGKRNCAAESILHIAPENAFIKLFKMKFGRYVSGDLCRRDVDRNFDVQDMPFDDGSFDMVFASHVLEYPEDDIKAISETRRILKPGGIAILPVPIVHHKTVDRVERDEVTLMMHEPGMDYFQRFERFFERVDLHRSDMYAQQHQLFIYRGAMAEKSPLYAGDGWNADVIPVCYV